MGKTLRAAAVALVGILTFGILVPPQSARAALPDSCKDVLFIGVRGSGEKNADAGGYGETVAAFKGILENRLRGKLTWRSTFLDYESNKVEVLRDDILHARRDYFNGISDGVTKLFADVNESLRTCGGTERIVLAGYSQGALVVHQVLIGLAASPLARASIASVDLFADPWMYGHTSTRRGDSDSNKNGIYQFVNSISSDSIPTDYRGRTRSWCNENDPVCSFSLANLAHQNVHVDSYKTLSAPSAGNRAADTLLAGYKPPPSTSGTGGPVDLVFAIDTTGSMGDDINSVKVQANAILGQIQAGSTSARAGIVLYKDLECDAYGAFELIPLTSDLSAVNAALQGISVDGGCDWPESVNSGLMAAIGQTWRNGVKKAIILMGDAPGKDPEPGTGYTIASVARAAFEVDPAIVFPIATQPDPETLAYFQSVADSTGGALFSVADGDVAGAVAAAVTEISAAPTAMLTVDAAPVGGDTAFSAVESLPGSATLAYFEWDLDGDGTYELRTDDAVTSKTFSAPFDGTVSVRVVDSEGRSGVATAPLHVAELPTAPVALTVTGVGIDADACGQLLRWTAVDAPVGKRADYRIVDPAGATVGTVEDGSTRWRVPAEVSDPAGLQVLAELVDASTETAPNDVSCVGPARDHLGLKLLSRRGRPLYQSEGALTTGDFVVQRDGAGRLRSVKGTGTIAGSRGPAEVTIELRPWWMMRRLMVGTVQVREAASGVNVRSAIATVTHVDGSSIRGVSPTLFHHNPSILTWTLTDGG